MKSPLYCFTNIDNRTFESKNENSKTQNLKQRRKTKFMSNPDNVLNFLAKEMDIHQKYQNIASEFSNILIFLKDVSEEMEKGNFNQKELEENYFGKFSNAISFFLTEQKDHFFQTEHSLLIQIFFYYSQIHKHFGQINSSKTLLFKNKCIKGIFIKKTKLSHQELLQILEAFANLDERNVKINFIIYKMIDEMSLYSLEEVVLILKCMAKLNYKNEVLVELIIDKLYLSLNHINKHDLIMIAHNYNKISEKVNKRFLIEFAQILTKNISENNKINYIILAFTSIAELERKYVHDFFSIGELDEFYYKALSIIKLNINKIPGNDIGNIANSLQKIGIYDEQLLSMIITAIFKFDFDIEDTRITELNNRSQKIESKIEKITSEEKTEKEYRNLLQELKSIKIEIIRVQKENKLKSNNLETLIKVLHCLAVFNYIEKSSKLVDYFIQLVKLYQEKFKLSPNIDFMKLGYVTKCLWSLSILKKPAEIKETSAFLLDFLLKHSNQNYNITYSDVTKLFWVYSYFKTEKMDEIFDLSLLQKIKDLYLELAQKNPHKVSLFCLDVAKALQVNGIAHILEVNIDNFFIDILIPENIFGVKILIDVCGYQHFFRNKQDLYGGISLKKNILEKKGYIFDYISIFDWQLLENKAKQDYINAFIKSILKKNNINSKI